MMNRLRVIVIVACLVSQTKTNSQAQVVDPLTLQQPVVQDGKTILEDRSLGFSRESFMGHSDVVLSSQDLSLVQTANPGDEKSGDLTFEPPQAEFCQTCEINPCDQVWVKLIPYIWATQVNGNLTVNGLTAPMNLDLYDLWKLLEDGEVRGGFMGHLEFGRDDWAIFINGDIISMDPSASSRRATLETGLTTTLLELGGAVDIMTANELDPQNSPFRVQWLGGVRYLAMDVSAILSLPNVNPVAQAVQGEQWVDLFTGARILAQIKPGVNAVVRGDWGGFGIGSSSNKSWNLVAATTFDLGYSANLLIGYRWFDVDQTLHGGTGFPQGFGVDAMIHGPLAGLVFQY